MLLQGKSNVYVYTVHFKTYAHCASSKELLNNIIKYKQYNVRIFRFDEIDMQVDWVQSILSF